MSIQIKVNEPGLTVHHFIPKKKSLHFSEAQLLKGQTAKNAHADEIMQLHPKEFRY